METTNNKKNLTLIESTEDEQFIFDLGIVLVSFMVELKLVKQSLKVWSKTEKVNILVPGSKLEQLIPNSEPLRPNLTAPDKIPMIVKPKLYEMKDNIYIQLGGYLLNDIAYTDGIILPNWELKGETTIASNNKIVDLVNNINSVAFRINQNVLDFFIKNNNRYNFFYRSK